jgi:uncharacterized Fe-S cluster protein YjdI/CDGSH-type Zn-finger protein
MSTKLHVYDGATVTVTFDAARCIHNAHCVRTLPEVFNTSARPWVQPDNATDAEALLRVVAGCPTGALQSSHRDGRSSAACIDRETLAVRAARHGPLFLRGAVIVEDADGTPIVSDERVALCRCGLSQRKPFCDNSHRAAGWRDTPQAAS